MLSREQIRELALEAKSRKGLTWPQLGEHIGRSPVYTAMLIYCYGQADETEAREVTQALSLPRQAEKVLTQAQQRMPAQPWPPTDPFVHRFYEAVLLYGPVFRDVAHEIFGDGIMSIIDMSVDIRRLEACRAWQSPLTTNGSRTRNSRLPIDP